MSSGFTSVTLVDGADLFAVARALADAGVEPDELIEWVRDGWAVFERPYPLSCWLGEPPFGETAEP